MPTPRRTSPNDGRYDRGEERARRFGALIREWMDEPGAPSHRQLAADVSAYMDYHFYESEIRRLIHSGQSGHASVGIAHLAKNDGQLIEAYLAALGKTSLEDRARAYRAVGLLPRDMTAADLMLGMASSKSRVA